MTEVQAGILETEYLKNPNWDNRKYEELCDRCATTKSRIYKWNWDRKRRDPSMKSPSAQSI